MIRNSKPALLAVAIAMVFAGDASTLASIVVNGSFETGTQDTTNPTVAVAIPGWSIGGNGVERGVAGSSIDVAPGAADDGLWFVDLAFFTTGDGIIRQTLATTVDTIYDMTFALGNSTYFGRDGTGVVDVYIDGNLVSSLNTPIAVTPTIVWVDFAVQFQATAPSTVIEFRNTQDPLEHYAFLDDVAVVQAAVPEPTSLIVWSALGALGLSVIGWRRAI
jgi:hypothetical protein